MNKEELSIEVLILKQFDFKDNDAIVHAIGIDGIHYTFFARGIRKQTSKNASALQPFMLSDVTYFNSEKSMYLLKSAKVKEVLYNFTDYNEMIAAHIIVDVINDISQMNVQANKKLYMLSIETLKIIKKYDESIVLSVFLIKIMSELGIELISDRCAVCDSTVVNYISIKHGGFICHNCLKNNDISLYDSDILKLFRLINKIEYNQLDMIDNDLSETHILLSLIYEFYISYSGFTIRNIKEFI